MTAINWSEEYSVGVHIIDADHKMLIDLINQCSTAVSEGHDHAKVDKVLAALYEYTDFHFIREEALMKACEYADLDQHREVHDKLRGQVRDIRDKHATNPTDAMDDEVMTFLTEWLTKHILGHDKRYAPSMEGKEREIAEAHRPFLQYWSEGADAEATDSA